MIRTPPSYARPRRPVLPLAVSLLAILAVLPTRWTGWLNPVGGVLDVIVAPAQWPIAAGIRSVRSQVRGGGLADADPLAAELRRETQRFEQLYLQALDENRRLTGLITSLQGGLAVAPGVRIHQVQADVIGLHADASTTLLKVKAGAASRVSRESVAVFDGIHLVGRVVDVEPQISRVLPTTDRAAGKLDVLVMLGEAPGSVAGAPGPLDTALRCLLDPTGEGTLRGPVEVPPPRQDLPRPEVKPGMVVRLEGARWPAPARMLIVGVVERVEPAANGRPIIVVKPVFELRDLASVIIRSPASDGPGPAAGEARP